MGSCLLFFGLSLLTVRLWGGDVSHDHLIMLIDGKMLGQMHLGEYDILDYESCWPRDFADKAHADSERAGAAIDAVPLRGPSEEGGRLSQGGTTGGG